MPLLLGDKLRYLRVSRRLTQEALTRQIPSIKQAYISKVEAGQYAPALDVLLRLASYFNVSTDYLLRDTVLVEQITIPQIPWPIEQAFIRPQFVGAKVLMCRQNQGLLQRELAERLALSSRAYLSNIEAGRKLPSLDLTVQLADIFGVSTDYLLRDDIYL